MLRHNRSVIHILCLLWAAFAAATPLAAQQVPSQPNGQTAAPAAENSPSGAPNSAPARQNGVSNPAPAAVTATTVAPFGEITGTVKSGTTPLPGVTVTAANTLTGKKYVTSTDVDGSFKIAVGGKGRYVVRSELSAFAPATQEVLINAENRTGKADLAMILQSRVQQQEQRQQQVAGAGGRGGLQQLSLSGGDMGAPTSGSTDVASLSASGLPNAGLAAEGNNESVAVSGAMGRNEMPTFDPGEMQDRIADMRDQMQR